MKAKVGKTVFDGENVIAGKTTLGEKIANFLSKIIVFYLRGAEAACMQRPTSEFIQFAANSI